jgi:hypothetical protein
MAQIVWPEPTPEELRVPIVLMAMLLAITIPLSIYFFQKNRTKLTLKYSVYWDKNKNPHCPACKSALTPQWTRGDGARQLYFCIPCKAYAPPYDLDGEPLSPKDVKDLAV